MLTGLVLACTLATMVHGHAHVKSPATYRSKELAKVLTATDNASQCTQGNPVVGKNCIDYDVNGPVDPKVGQLCKGYPLVDKEMKSQASWTAGNSQKIELSVHASHRGGVCQFGLSYDMGKTIKTVQTVPNCLKAEAQPTTDDSSTTQTFSLNLPKDIPNGEALFSWSWFNTEGNREMYNDCSLITISGGTAQTMPTTYKDIVILNVPNLEPNPKCVSKQGTVPDLTKLADCIGTYARSHLSDTPTTNGNSTSTSGNSNPVTSDVPNTKTESPTMDNNVDDVKGTTSDDTSESPAATSDDTTESPAATSDDTTESSVAPRPTRSGKRKCSN